MANRFGLTIVVAVVAAALGSVITLAVSRNSARPGGSGRGGRPHG